MNTLNREEIVEMVLDSPVGGFEQAISASGLGVNELLSLLREHGVEQCHNTGRFIRDTDKEED